MTWRARLVHVAMAATLTAWLASTASAQSSVTFVGLGDSIGEGVQSADANAATQGFSYLNLMAWRMGATFPLPLIQTNPFGAAGSTDGRSRLDLSVRGLNLAVSGADAFSILYDRADAATASAIDSETDLVLFPRIGSQIEVAEALRPEYVACWIGSNDALGAVLAFDHLDASQLTPVAAFAADFTQLADRLAAMGGKVVVATVPDVTAVGYTLTDRDLVRFLGSSYGLPDGSVTTVPAMMLVKLGLLPSSTFSDPNFVLDPIERQAISQRIGELNAVIVNVATARGMAIVDMHGIFDYLAAQPLNVGGVDVTTKFLGGLFSLDGVHPSNFGQALVAYFFIDALNRQYGAGIPQIDGDTLGALFLTDPFIDRDGDGRVVGRFGAGLLETVFGILGISGDSSEVLSGAAAPRSSLSSPATAEAAATAALDAYQRQTGTDLRRLTADARIEAFRRLFNPRR